METANFRRLKKSLSWLEATPLHPKWLIRHSQNKVNALKAINDGILLDVGCSNRWAAQHLSDHVRYIGLDHPLTSTKLYGTKPDVYADARMLPFEDNTFDVITLFDVLEHIEHPMDTLKEVHRVLRKGGQLLVSIPFLYPLHDEPYDFQRLTPYGLKRDFQKAGFNTIRVKSGPRALETACGLLCLSLAAVSVRSIAEKRISILFVPLVLCLIPILNLSLWAASRVFPNWEPLTTNYWVETRKG